MTTQKQQQQLWLRLLDLADSVKQATAGENAAVQDIIAELNTLAEVYDRQFDPADDFKEYVAIALVKSIAKLQQ